MKRYYLLVLFLVLISVVAYAHETGTPHLELPPGLVKQIEYQKELALGVTFLIALIAGIVTFTSPCSFVLLPVYFSFLFKERKKGLLATSSFILGLTIAFALFGLIAGLIGTYFNNYKLYLASISGFFIAIFGIMMILNKGFNLFTPKLTNNKKSIFSFLLVGFLFGVGWSPCVGPILGSIFFLAANSGTLLKSMLLLITYAMGIAIPLLLFAIFSDRVNISDIISKIGLIKFKIFKKQIVTNWYNIIGGLIIFLIGLITIFYKGTTYVEYLVSYTTGWVMNSFVGLNNNIRLISLGSLSNIIGILLGLLILIFILVIIYKGIKKEK